MDIMTIVIASSVVFIALLVVGKLVLVKVMANSGKGGALTPEAVLHDAEIFIAYGKKEDAIHCLKSGLEAFPQHEGLLSKLRELH